MTHQSITRILEIIDRMSRDWQLPVVSEMSAGRRSPYRALISTILSLRTKDAVTAAASQRLFALADTPETMVTLDPGRIARAIYPVAFYNVKSRQILDITHTLIARHQGAVPATMEELLALKGVGRKTANLVLILGFGIPAMCVDTHVHRISNRLGYVRTKTPEQTERALRAKLPKRHWFRYNDLLVAFGQNHCRPVSPLCTTCPVSKQCRRVGVRHFR